MATITHFAKAVSVGIGKGTSEAIANTGYSQGSTGLYVQGTLGVNGAAYFDSTLTVGLDGTGYDVQLFGATASAHLLWDESQDQLELNGVARMKLPIHQSLPASPDRGTQIIYNIGGPSAKAYKLYFYSGSAWELITSS